MTARKSDHENLLRIEKQERKNRLVAPELFFFVGFMAVVSSFA